MKSPPNRRQSSPSANSAANRRQNSTAEVSSPARRRNTQGEVAENASAHKSPSVSPSRTSALQILLRCRRDGRLESAVCEKPEDRRLADQIAFGTVQNGRYIDTVLDSFVKTGLRALHPAVREILRLSAYQMLFLDRVPESAVVNDAVTLCRQQKCAFAAGFVNAVLRSLSRGREKIDIREPAVRYSHPDWVYTRLKRDFGASFTEEFMKASQTRPDLRLQLNIVRCTLDEYLALLEDRKLEALDVNRDLSSVLLRPCDPATLPGYDDGLFYVQDDAARTAVRIAELRPGMRVLDACAAPGGKSMAAALDGAEVFSCDISEKRLERCRENFARMKMDIAVWLQDASVFRGEWEEGFDCVLADVPCTGTGIIRKHPEIREKTEDELFSLLPIQQAITQNLAHYVKPGGLLIYSTCSVLREEDEEQVRQFLEQCDDFSLEAVSADGYCSDGGMLRSWPQENGNDGFFAAKLRKRT